VTARGKLLGELTKQLIPALHERGFSGPAAIKGNRLLHEFRRKAGDSHHVLNVQLDKYQRPWFRIDLSIEPPEGFEVALLRGDVLSHAMVEPYRNKWFRADTPWWHRLFGAQTTRARRAVGDCVALLDEVASWWSKQVSSAHIFDMPWSLAVAKDEQNA